MKRKLAFRIWHEKLNRMIYDIRAGRTYQEWQDETGKWWELTDEDIMQFTGLTDHNGKDIYEGDIVRFEDGIHTGNVLWDYPTRSWRVNLGTQYFLLPERTTVIGNIYEKPEQGA